MMPGLGFQTWDTLVEGKNSHHCAIPTPGKRKKAKLSGPNESLSCRVFMLYIYWIWLFYGTAQYEIK